MEAAGPLTFIEGADREEVLPGLAAGAAAQSSASRRTHCEGALGYPKALPARYDVQPARWTLAVGFRFQPLWAPVQGAGPPACRASESSCLAEAGLQTSLDLHVWRLLLTAHGEAVAAGDRSYLVTGGRVAADVAGVASLFSEARLQLPLVASGAQRAGVVLLGEDRQGAELRGDLNHVKFRNRSLV